MTQCSFGDGYTFWKKMLPSSSESKRIEWGCGWVIQVNCKEGASSERRERGGK